MTRPSAEAERACGRQLWSTFFRNGNAGYWADPSRNADAGVPGVVRVEWTGPAGNHLYVQRRNHGQAIAG